MSSRRLSSERQPRSSLYLDDDDNNSQTSQTSDTSSVDLESTTTAALDPLLTAIDELEGRIVNCLDDFKLHPGVKSDPSSDSIHAELRETLRPVLEIAAHVGPVTARSKWKNHRPSLDAAIEEVYKRLNSDLILPVLLESAQSDLIPAKRAAALTFFHNLYAEYKASGSYLDYAEAGPGSSTAMNATFSGALYGTMDKNVMPLTRAILKQRTLLKAEKNLELLRYWVEGATACNVPGAFSDLTADGSIASRAIISASAVIRPALRHVSEKIASADDAGALRLFIPVMRMIGGVLRRLFTTQTSLLDINNNNSMNKNASASADAVISSCIKLVEIVILCFSTKEQSGTQTGRRGGRQQLSSSEDFGLDDFPMGHPIITRQALEEIGEDAFTILRGLTIIGGQVKVDSGVMRDVMLGIGLDSNGSGSPTAQIVAILKPAALSYLEVESTIGQNIAENNPFPKVERSNLETDFELSQKSYALTINAVSMLARNRPTFFKDSATCLARRSMDPPTIETSRNLTKAGVLTVQSHLKASCLTLLRNALSVTTRASDILHSALSSDKGGMKIQANKALNMAKHLAHLKTAGRAERNRAKVYYEWDQSKDEEMEDSSRKRKAAGNDALERMRMAKLARGLGQGIQLPTSMVDSCELILLNLSNIPSNRAAVTAREKLQTDQKRKKKMNLDYFVDAIMTNGASLVSDESRWYGRDGGDAWMMDIVSLVSEDENEDMTVKGEKKSEPTPITFTLDTSTLDAAKIVMTDKSTDESKLYRSQCDIAAADAFQRILTRSREARDKSVADFGNTIAARMAWSLKGVKPLRELKDLNDSVLEGIANRSRKEKDDHKSGGTDLKSFTKEFPLVSSCLTFDLETSPAEGNSTSIDPTFSLSNRILHEAYGNDISSESESQYGKSLELYISTVLQSCEKADNKPNDNTRKKLASVAAASLPQHLAYLPSITPKSLELTSSLCDIDSIMKKAVEASRKSSNQNLAASASAHAAKAAAEKRAKGALLALRDAAVLRTRMDVRQSAVNCAVGIAAGRLPASESVEDMARRLVINVLYTKAPDLAEKVVSSATDELERAATYAKENQEKIRKANKVANNKRSIDQRVNSLTQSDEEKAAIEFVKKPVNMFIAICIRKPELIATLMTISSREGVDVLNKAVRNVMPVLTRPLAKKYGAARIALQVADMVDETKNSLLLSFLDNLAPSDGELPTQDLINACNEIQSNRASNDGKIDARFIVPVVSGMKRHDLVDKLPEFVAADDVVFKAALRRMSERLVRHAGVFSEDSEREGMTLCEQMVFLHRMDFAAAGLKQKRYLDAINICLQDHEVFTDRIILAALDHMSRTFLSGENLPLAYMRTIILTYSKHESLHPWICNELLPRLIEGKIYTDRRQWEGWMRTAKMLENTGDAGISSLSAIEQLPQEQYRLYRDKYPIR
mmetsp:Transcript_3429/g.4004  ORF Transcript_3429/g.4004 Transcript_3429/m.4004 type:complete len:1434 (-) Transcript_3429:56-4357(-)